MTFPKKEKGFKPKSFWENPKGTGWKAKRREKERREEKKEEKREEKKEDKKEDKKEEKKEHKGGEQSSKDLISFETFIYIVLIKEERNKKNFELIHFNLVLNWS